MTVERPDIQAAKNIIRDLRTGPQDQAKLSQGIIYALDYCMYTAEMVELLPNEILSQLNGEFTKALTEHTEACAKEREEAEPEDPDDDLPDFDGKGGFIKGSLVYLLKHNAYVFGIVVVAAMHFFKAPLTMFFTKMLNGG